MRRSFDVGVIHSVSVRVCLLDTGVLGVITSDIFCFSHCEAVGDDGENTSFVVMRWIRTGERSKCDKEEKRMRRTGYIAGLIRTKRQ